jgi:uncharacterized protein YoaH (UPF0181 family)
MRHRLYTDQQLAEMTAEYAHLRSEGYRADDAAVAAGFKTYSEYKQQKYKQQKRRYVNAPINTGPKTPDKPNCEPTEKEAAQIVAVEKVRKLRAQGVPGGRAAIEAGFREPAEYAAVKARLESRGLIEKAPELNTFPNKNNVETHAEKEAAQIVAVEKVWELRTQGVPGGRAAIEAGFREPAEYLATKAMLEIRGLIEKKPEMKIQIEPVWNWKPLPKPTAPEAIAGMEPIPDVEKQFPVPTQTKQKSKPELEKADIRDISRIMSEAVAAAAKGLQAAAEQLNQLAKPLRTNQPESGEK